VVTADLGALRLGQSLERELGQLTDRETLGQEHLFSASFEMTRQKAQRSSLFVGQVSHGGMRQRVTGLTSFLWRVLRPAMKYFFGSF
jgi:hypothetical protein